MSSSSTIEAHQVPGTELSTRNRSLRTGCRRPPASVPRGDPLARDFRPDHGRCPRFHRQVHLVLDPFARFAEPLGRHGTTVFCRHPLQVRSERLCLGRGRLAAHPRPAADSAHRSAQRRTQRRERLRDDGDRAQHVLSDALERYVHGHRTGATNTHSQLSSWLTCRLPGRNAPSLRRADYAVDGDCRLHPPPATAGVR